MSYSVVVVEDEPDIANGLKKLVERLSPECKVVGVAHDGEEGMQKIQYFNADIVLTDIRMPGMDGIEMIKRLKSLGCNAQFVILTGYAEFSYARSAVRLGVCDYLTKPIEEDELSFILHKIGSSLEDSHRSMSHIESLEGKIEIYSKSIREYELKSFLESDETDQKLILSEIKRFGFPMDASYGCAMVEFAESESDLSSVLDLSQNYWLFPCQKNTTAVFVAFDSEPNWEGFWQSIHQTLKDKACIGLSEIHQSAAKLREAYLEARHALNYKVIRGSALISYSDVKQFRGVGVTVSPSNLKRLEECMDAMDNDELAIVINSIFKELSQMTDLSLTDLQLVSLDLILAGVRKIPCLRMQLNSFLGKNILSLDSIANFQTMDELSNWIISILASMNDLMLKDLIPERKDVISQAIDYMNKNFSKGVSLKELAERFYLNPFYFSTLFKKKTGQTYQSYLMSIRVNRAKKLLEKTDLKLHEICEMVGYRDLDHFGKVFERIEGMKMYDYRKRLDQS